MLDRNSGLGVGSILGLALMVLMLCAMYAALASIILCMLSLVGYIVVYLAIYYPLRKRSLLRQIEAAKSERTPEGIANRRKQNGALADERAARLRLLRSEA